MNPKEHPAPLACGPQRQLLRILKAQAFAAPQPLRGGKQACRLLARFEAFLELTGGNVVPSLFYYLANYEDFKRAWRQKGWLLTNIAGEAFYRGSHAGRERLRI